jgi:hypothetical protein
VIASRGLVPAVLYGVVYAASFVLVLWASIDALRRPSSQLPPTRKAAWAIGSILGWLVFGAIGGVIALLYLSGPRRRLNARRL